MSLYEDDLRATLEDGEAIIVVGAGVSIAATADPKASWAGLLKDGIVRASETPGTPARWGKVMRDLFDVGDVPSWLTVADGITQRLGGVDGPEFKRWLKDAVGGLRTKPNQQGLIEAIVGLGAPLCTTNYDDVLSLPGTREPLTWVDEDDVRSFLQGAPGLVLHIHGHWKKRGTAVFGGASYQALVASEVSSAAMRTLFSSRSIVFVGCGSGLEDPHFSLLRQWMGSTWGASQERHFRLVHSQDPVAMQPLTNDRIVPVVYGDSHDDLAPFLARLRRPVDAVYSRAHIDADHDPAVAETEIDLSPPVVNDAVARDGLTGQLSKLLQTNALVVVEGLAGAGKTYLVADAVAELERDVIWFDPAPGANLDGAIQVLAAGLNVDGHSSLSRERQLVSALSRRNAILIIDNFQRADMVSFDSLIRAVTTGHGNAQLVLLSRDQVPVAHTGGRAARLVVNGLTMPEVGQLLEARGIQAPPERWQIELKRQVEGLPIACVLFAVMVRELGRDGDDLLAGDLPRDELVRGWFEDVVKGLQADARALLEPLSLVNGLFDSSLVNWTGRRLKLASSDKAFAGLLGSHLVQKFASDRWSVHQLVATMTHTGMAGSKLRADHSGLADFYLGAGRGWPGELLDEEVLAQRVAGARHLRMAGRGQDLDSLLSEIVATVKTRGHYGLFLEIAEPSLQREGHDPWLDYNVAHCQYGMGRLSAAAKGLAASDPRSYESDAALTLSMRRLEAEILGAAGQPAKALELLLAANAATTLRPSHNLVRQAAGIEPRLWLALGQNERAKNRAKELLNAANRGGDILGAAIASTHLGQALLALGQSKPAVDRLARSRIQFADEGYLRGQAWAASWLARARFAAGRRRDAVVPAAEAIRLRSDFAESGPDYLDFLEFLAGELGTATPALVAEEIARVKPSVVRELAAFASLPSG